MKTFNKCWSLLLISVVLCLPSLPIQAADALVSKVQLEKIFTEINDSWKRETAKDIKHYGDVERIKLDDIAGYSSGLSFYIRAQMYPDRVAETVEVFGLPAIIYFPPDPKTAPLIIQSQTIKVHNQVQEAVLDSAEVKVPLNAMSGEESAYVVYGQTVLENTTTEISGADNAFIVESKIDISSMDLDDAKEYFEAYQGLIANLNAELQKIDNVEMEAWYDAETDAAEKTQNELKKGNYTRISNQDVFTTLVGWRLNATNLVEEPVSELGHWGYEDPDADDEYNVSVEVINYGDHYKMLYLVGYNESVDEDEQLFNEMLGKMNDYLAGKLPQGAKSVEAVGTNYYGVAEVVVVYSLEAGPKGSEIYENAEAFDKFVAKTYGKTQGIADQYE